MEDTDRTYVVVALASNGGHGEWPAMVQVTRDAVAAVRIARMVEELGYRVNFTDIAVSVYGVRMGEPIHEHNSAYQRVYSRGGTNADGGIREYFHSAALASQFSMTQSYNWEPSEPIEIPVAHV